MTAGQLALAAAVVLAAAGLSAVGVILAHHWWRIRRGRRIVRAAIERETARRAPELVPSQRVPTDPQPWWDFVPQQDGDR